MSSFVSMLSAVKFRMVCNSIHEACAQSKLKVCVIVTFMLTFTIGLFALFFEGFHFLGALEPNVARIIIDRLMYLFYFFIFIMLIISSSLISFQTMYGSREMPFLIMHPITYGNIYFYKLIESAVLSSWSFIFVIGPFALSYGLYCNVRLSYYGMMPIVFISFIFIAASWGAIIATIIVRWYSSRYFRKVVIAGCIIIAIAITIYYFRIHSLVRHERENIMLALNTLIPHFRYAQYPLLPSYWLSESLWNVAKGYYATASFYLLVLVSNVLFWLLIAYELGTQFFYTGWVGVQATVRSRVYYVGRSIIETICSPLRKIFSSSWYALVVKDMKIFWRAPAQWSQLVIFFGILGFYFSNLQHFSYHILKPIMKQFTALSNLSAMMLVLASITVRFIFPQLSLEGKRYWFIGIAPIRFRSIFLQKFLGSLLWATTVSLGLTIISNQKLEIDVVFMYFSYGAVLCMSVTLVSMGCGLGAIFPNFKEDNPARLIAGFGGTLLFVLNLAYVAFMIFLIAWPFSLYFSSGDHAWLLIRNRFIVSGGSIVFVSLVGSFLSIFLGIKALKQLEF
ncbi:MAG: hypothetical protein KKH94_02450 [Candidatus Omnitrophica bacterium]|nr:hypothetical protein [Candidatus Omnitrophota bacterium]